MDKKQIKCENCGEQVFWNKDRSAFRHKKDRWSGDDGIRCHEPNKYISVSQSSINTYLRRSGRTTRNIVNMMKTLLEKGHVIVWDHNINPEDPSPVKLKKLAERVIESMALLNVAATYNEINNTLTIDLLR